VSRRALVVASAAILAGLALAYITTCAAVLAHAADSDTAIEGADHDVD
jgi:hypothetical protein